MARALFGPLDERVDQLVPADASWQFDRDVTDVFENMLARSIPQHGTMRTLVFDLGATLVQPQMAGPEVNQAECPRSSIRTRAFLRSRSSRPSVNQS